MKIGFKKKKTLNVNNNDFFEGDHVSFEVYRISLDAFSVIRGQIIDFDEEYMYMNVDYLDDEKINVVQKIPHKLIEEDSYKSLD